MGKIKVDTDRLRTDAEALSEKKRELDTLNRNLQGLLARIGESWEGEASAAYLNLMQSYAGRAQEIAAVLEEFRSYAERAAERFETADREAAAALRNSF